MWFYSTPPVAYIFTEKREREPVGVSNVLQEPSIGSMRRAYDSRNVSWNNYVLCLPCCRSTVMSTSFQGSR